MEKESFQKLKLKFGLGDIDTKIDIYVTTPGLTAGQYKQLLRMFPMNELDRLEAALA